MRENIQCILLPGENIYDHAPSGFGSALVAMAYHARADTALAKKTEPGYTIAVNYLNKCNLGESDLIQVAYRGYTHIVEFLLAQGVPGIGRAFVHTAKYGKPAALQFLLDLGVTPNEEALENAVDHHSVEKARMLIEAGVDPRSLEKTSPFYNMVRHDSVELAKYLRSKGVQFPLYYRNIALSYGYVELAKLLPGITYERNCEALVEAEYRGYPAVFEYLMSETHPLPLIKYPNPRPFRADITAEINAVQSLLATEATFAAETPLEHRDILSVLVDEFSYLPATQIFLYLFNSTNPARQDLFKQKVINSVKF